MLIQQLSVPTADDRTQDERDDDRVVQLTGDRDEVRDQIDRHREVSDRDRDEQLSPTGQAPVAKEPPHQHDAIRHEPRQGPRIRTPAEHREKRDAAGIDDDDRHEREGQRPQAQHDGTVRVGTLLPSTTAGAGRHSEHGSDVDYVILHYLNGIIVAHPLLESAVQLLATWIVPLVVAATVIPWLASGRGVDARKRATAGALGAAGMAMLANQLISHLWERPRPYAVHAAIVPFAGVSSDPSFPSDHVAAAFAIAVGAGFASRRAGRVLIVLACLVAVSRVLGAAHYPSDVLGGAIVGVVSGLVIAKLEGLWLPTVRLVATATDPVRLRVTMIPTIGQAICDERFRGRVVLAFGIAIGLRMAYGIGGHVLDEMPLVLLAGWGVAVLWLAREASRGSRRGTSVWRAGSTR